MVYDRKADTPPTATMSEPKRLIGGPKSRIDRPRAEALSPRTQEIIVAGVRFNSVPAYYSPEIV